MQHAINIGISATLFVLGIELKRTRIIGWIRINKQTFSDGKCAVLSLSLYENFVQLLFGPRSDFRVLAASDVVTIQV